jgi:hypothetical protein
MPTGRGKVMRYRYTNPGVHHSEKSGDFLVNDCSVLLPSWIFEIPFHYSGSLQIQSIVG